MARRVRGPTGCRRDDSLNPSPIQSIQRTQCNNGGNRTRIRIIQYSIYGDRGVYIAKKLRQLWNQGCDVKMIYALSTRPVMAILRNGSGRGAIPVRQSVITGKGRVIMFANNPIYRWQNHGEFNMVFNSVLNWNDMPTASQPAAPTTAGDR